MEGITLLSLLSWGFLSQLSFPVWAFFELAPMAGMLLDCLHHTFPTSLKLSSTWYHWLTCHSTVCVTSCLTLFNHYSTWIHELIHLFDYPHLNWHITSTTSHHFSSTGSKLSFDPIPLLNTSFRLSFSSTDLVISLITSLQWLPFLTDKLQPPVTLFTNLRSHFYSP